MNRLLGAVLIVGSTGLGVASAAELKLVQDKQCLQCHAVDKATIGPSFQSIAKRWKGQSGAEASLVATIQKGSDGAGGTHWNMKAKMPDTSERPLVSNAEAQQIARWILSQ